MNIIVRTFSGKYIVRPDTTWERDNEDLYLPEFVNSVSYTPVLFTKISKPGRSIGESFASRYHEGVNCGVLLYPDDLIDSSPEGFAEASCLDHSSFLPFPIYEENSFAKNGGNLFELYKDNELLFSSCCDEVKMIGKAIAEASRRIYFRSGDIIGIELARRSALCSREDKASRISANFRENQIMDFKLIF